VVIPEASSVAADVAPHVGSSEPFSTLYDAIDDTINSTPNPEKGQPIMSSISANELKTQGVSAIAEALSESPEAMVSVRGKDRFVVMDIEHYHYLRECELTAALAESQADIAAGRFVKESVDAHMKRLAKLS